MADVGGRGYGITPIGSNAEAGLIAAYRSRSASRHTRVHRADEPPFGGSRLVSEGGPVMHSVTTHVIYWDPTGQFTTTTKGIVESFLANVAHDSGQATSTFAVAGQYTDATGNAAYSSTFGGALVDKAAYPTSGDCTAPVEPGADAGPYSTCLFDSQLQSELSEFIDGHGLPRGPSQLYLVLLPHDVATCLGEEIEGKQACSNNVYCAYHSWIAPGPQEVIYADIPFSLLDSESAKGCQADGFSQIQLPNGDRGSSDAETRFADVALKYLSHEYVESATDPLVGLETAWVDEEGLEIGDKCNAIPLTIFEEGLPGFDRNAFRPTLGGSSSAGTLYDQSIDGGHYYLQSMWDNAADACLMQPLSLGAGSFTPPSGTAGSPVSFAGFASDPYDALEPTWSFGDGAVAKGVSVSHSYASAGSYLVTMTPKDALTGSAGEPVSHEVTIATGSGGGGGAGGGGGTGSGSGSTQGGSSSSAAAGGALASITATPTATVALAGSAISIGSNGAGAVKLSCTGTATCSGTLTIVAKTPGRHGHSVKIGTAGFSIAAGTTKAITVKFTASGRSLLKAGHGHMSASLTIDKSSPAPQAKMTRAVRLSQKR